MNADEYRRHYSTGHARTGFSRPNAVRIPANVERREGHQPCGYCGVRPDVPCKHKEMAW